MIREFEHIRSGQPANLRFSTNGAARIRIQVIDLSAETYTSTGTLHLFKRRRIKVE
jgi:hypothetical protein